jgi:serine/threonine protein kinase
MSKTHNVVGEGTYGCVLKPSLKCNDDNNINYTNKVSKVMKKSDAKKEFKEYEQIKNIPNLYRYAISTPTYCDPKIDKTFNSNVTNCTNDNVKETFENNPNDLGMLLIEDGGIDLQTLVTKVFGTIELDGKKQFLKSIINLFDGLIFFRENDIIHRDIKSDNVVYNVHTGKIKYIDFGLMTSKTELIKNCQTNTEPRAHSHSYWPPENSCTNKRVFYFDNAKCRNLRNNFASHAIFLEKATTSFDSYCLTYALVKLFSYISTNKLIKGFNIFFNSFKPILMTYCEKNIVIRETDMHKLKAAYIEALKKNYLYPTTLVTPSPSPSPSPSHSPSPELINKIKSINTEKKEKKEKKEKTIKSNSLKSKTIKNNDSGSTKKRNKCTSINKDYNHITRRCNMKCAANKKRDRNFKCVKNSA